MPRDPSKPLSSRTMQSTFNSLLSWLCLADFMFLLSNVANILISLGFQHTLLG